MLRRFNNPLRVPIVKAGQHTSRPVYEILFSKLATSTGDSSSPRAAKEVALLHSHHITNLGCWRDAPASVRQALAASSEEGKEAAQILDAALQEEGESLKDVANKKILICYGSQTGTAEGLAKMTALMAKSTAGLVPVIATMNDAVNLLTSRDDLQFASILIICSTYGVGDVPTNGLKFLEQLNKSGSALQNKLKSIPSAVLGLGNSQNTDNFNAAAKKITAKLQEIGSAQLIPPIYSCELAEEGHDAKFRIYKAACWSAMAKRQIGSGDKTATQGLADLYEASPCIGIKAEKTHSRSFQRVDWFPATVTYNEVKSAKGYEPAFRHMLVELDNRKVQEVLGRKLKPTDSLLVQPHNPAAYVNRALKLFGLTGDEVFDITPLPGASSNWFDGHKLSARTIFSEVIDLSGVPARSTIASLIPSATDAKDKAALEALANDLSAKNEYSALVKKIFTTIDLLERFPSLKLTLAQALSRLPAISPRHYSNCHHPQVLSNKFEIIYSIPTRHSGNVTHVGLATGGMAECKPGDSELWISVEEGKTQLPPVEAPVVALGLGSGIGLVRAMLEERAAAAKAGTKVGKCVLIYGFHEVGKDQLFKEELDAHLKSGVISDLRYVASYEGAKFIKSPFDEINKDLAAFMNQPDTRLFYCGPGGLQRLLESQCRRAGINVRKMKAENRYIEEYFSPDQDADKLLKLHQAEANSQATLAEKFADSEMFCFQCEQTQHCKTGGVANFGIGGCAGKVGVCGKKASTAALQDLTVYYYKVLSFYLDAARAAGAPENVAYNRLTLFSLFSTLTNVNFDDERFVKILADLHSAINTSKADYEAFCASKNMKPVTLPADQMQIDKTFNPDVKELIAAGRAVGVLTRFIDAGAQNAASVCEMLTFGLKGLAAYTDHSLQNGKENQEIYNFMHKAGAFLVSRDRHDLGKAVGMCVECGKVNITAMGLLYDSHEGSLSAPTLATAAVKPKPGKALLVSGHDLIILKKLLPLCDEAGINVYTHGEMLPAHGYEGLRKHKSLAGHYGGAWMRQALEFPHFPGPVLMTTNCLIENTEEVRARLFTAGAVGWPGCEHIGNTPEDINFKPLLAAALESTGFTANDTEFSYPDPVGTTRPANYTVGAGHKQILALAPVVLEEIQKGNITRFFLIGGCDGFEGSRNYYADLVKNLPPTTVILGVGCGKFRYNWMDLGTIPGGKIPRYLDIGQCNDSFSAVQVAVALAGALKCEVADLPLSIVLSWFEQKAVAVLLSCVALGLKTLRVGPALPSFITNDVLGVLVKDMGILPLGDPAVDAKTMLAAKGMDDRISVAAEGKGEKK